MKKILRTRFEKQYWRKRQINLKIFVFLAIVKSIETCLYLIHRYMKKIIVPFLLILISITSAAQENITINTNSTQIILKVGKEKNLTFEYFGKKIDNTDNLFDSKANTGADAYPAFGIRPDRLMALRVKHADGDLSLVLKFQSYVKTKIDNNIELTTILLKDEVYPFFVTLNYKAYIAEDVIEVWSEIFHQESKGVTLYDFASAYMSFNPYKAYLTHFHGSWGDEFMMEETEINRGTFTIENMEGVRNTQSDNPSFFLSLNNKASEDNGEVIAGSLAWTGNYKIIFSNDRNSQLQITAGISNYASDYTLEKGKKFTTPELIITYSSQGKGEASRNLHRYARKYKMLDGNKERKVLLNSWEGVYFDFDEKKIVAMIDDIARIGGELFVLDDGWFGNKYSRDANNLGLGDWQTSVKKLPSGIENLINEAEKRGIKFGIWVEPEMVNTTSELYEKHPEWVLQNKNRELVKGRGKTQLVLDLTNPAVQDFVFNVVNDLLDKYPRIDYIKWDANMDISNYGSTYLPADKQSNLYIDYHFGLQNVFKRLREKHPNTTMQACASGGGRVTYGYLPYFQEFWTSDNTDALQRIYTQWGMSQFFPSITMASHVSAAPNHQTQRVIPLKFRFDVAMTGRLGLEMQPKDMNEKEWNFSISAIKLYKEIRPVIQFGDLYRIISPFDDLRLASLIYVDEQKNNAVFFAYYLEKKVGELNHPLFKFKGLNQNSYYSVKEVNKADAVSHFAGDNKIYSGRFLMDTGVKLTLKEEYDSVILLLNTVK